VIVPGPAANMTSGAGEVVAAASSSAREKMASSAPLARSCRQGYRCTAGGRKGKTVISAKTAANRLFSALFAKLSGDLPGPCRGSGRSNYDRSSAGDSNGGSNTVCSLTVQTLPRQTLVQ